VLEILLSADKPTVPPEGNHDRLLLGREHGGARVLRAGVVVGN
jgi:hypothetical protein